MCEVGSGLDTPNRPLTHSSDLSREGLAVNATHVEQWRPIPGFGSYEASSLGRIRSIDRTVTNSNGMVKRLRGTVLRAHPHKGTGYLTVSLHEGGKPLTCKVHALVAMAFHGSRPEGLHACHNDGNRTNNQAHNLRWDTRSENERDKVRQGVHHHARKTHCKWGHALLGENVRLHDTGLFSPARVCRTCNSARGYIRMHPDVTIEAARAIYYKKYMPHMAESETN